MANIKISELNELYGHQRAYDDYIPVVDSSADETKKISVGSLIPNNVNIIAVTDTAPTEYETGDKYYNTDENKIYTATSWGWENPETPIGGILYIILSEQKSYTYDWDNETLISVGGGGGGGIAVAPDEPEEDTKLYIESTDLDFQGLEIANEYTTGNNVAYSADYCNSLLTSKIEVQKKDATLTGSNWTTIPITFTKTYTEIPGVFVTYLKKGTTTSRIYDVVVANVTTTGCEVLVYNLESSAKDVIMQVLIIGN